MNGFGPSAFSVLPPVVKNLLIINGLMLLATYSIGISTNVNLNHVLGLHYPASPLFEPYQFVTYMFMHGGFTHLFFNMFAVWMFGSAIENYWGAKRFLIYYLITGVGASLLHFAIAYFEILQIEALLDIETIEYVKTKGAELVTTNRNFVDPDLAKLNALYNTPLVGASGALFGILLAFGMMFPNTHLYLFLFPIPIKAKYFVAGYGAIELFNGLQNNPNDNVAHFAHLGGMLFGYILIRYWRSNSRFR